MKHSGLDDKLEKLAAIAHDLPSEAARGEFRKAFASTNNSIVARAAQLAGRAGDRELIPALIETFGRLLKSPAAADKSCRAKSAIVDALDDLEHEWYEPFLQGVAYRQFEPVYGGREDTAADLRANCAIMLARRNYPDIFFVLADLLVDPEASPRLAAVTVLGSIDSETSELLLRMKARMGDQDAGVLRKCFAALLRFDTDRSWDLVAGFLNHTDSGPEPSRHRASEIAENAAIALGDSHHERAFVILRNAFEETLDTEFRRTLLLAMVLTRLDEAIGFLIDIIKTDSVSRAALAVEALSINSDDEPLRKRVREAVVSRENDQLTAAYERGFRE